jgi:hypothetical protein
MHVFACIGFSFTHLQIYLIFIILGGLFGGDITMRTRYVGIAISSSKKSNADRLTQILLGTRLLLTPQSHSSINLRSIELHNI